MSSAAVVGVLKRLTGEKRVGHAGTLDPMAAGVLPIMVGRATRLFDYLVDKRKEYVTVCAFGAATDTQDATGQVLETGNQYPSLTRIEGVLSQLTGEIRQTPSMYSAIKVNGKRLYALARKGEQVAVPERMVHVERIEILGEEPDHGVRLRIACGRGTYIRSICHDLGKLCGCPAHMRSLIRTESGFFRLADAMDPEEARRLGEAGRLTERLLSLDAPIDHLPRMNADPGLERKVSAGAALPLRDMWGDAVEEGEITRVYLEGDFWGIAQRQGDTLTWRAQMPPEKEENMSPGENGTK